MKNKATKNLIFLFLFAILIFGANFTPVSAIYYDGTAPYGYDGNSGSYANSVQNNYLQKQQQLQQQYDYEQRQLQLENQLAQQKYENERQKIIQEQNLASQKNGVATNNTQLAQPATTQIQYVPQQTSTQYTTQPTISYVPAGTQGAAAYNATTKNTGVKDATGKYVSYDANNLGASAYGYNNGYTNATPVTNDPNGVAALSMNGSGGFMPSSVFQWFMIVLLILAIVIVARIIIKKRASQNTVHVAPTH